MNKLQALLTGLGAGAGYMYFYDPDRGRRRRALLRDQCTSTCHAAEDAWDATLRDVSHRLEGLRAETRALLSGNDEVDDQVLVDRVRSKIGRYTSHPRAIEVTAQDGCVALSGPILSGEAPGLLSAVRSVRGVKEVENHLEPHDHPDISALQGGTPRQGEQLDLLQNNWSPATRLWAGTLGTTLMFNCLARRTFTSMLLGTFGFGLFLRSVANRPVKYLLDDTALRTRPGRGQHTAGQHHEQEQMERFQSPAGFVQ